MVTRALTQERSLARFQGVLSRGQKIGAEDAGREDSETTVVTPRGDLWGRGGSEITRAALPQWQCPVPCGQAQHLPKGPHLGYSSHIWLGLFVLLFIISAVNLEHHHLHIGLRGPTSFLSAGGLLHWVIPLMLGLRTLLWASLVAQPIKNPPEIWETWVQSLGWAPGEGNGYPFQYSCLENSMDRGAWQAIVHGVAKNRTRLSDFHFNALLRTPYTLMSY